MSEGDPQNLQLLRDGAGDGATNMAVDEVLLERCIQTGQPFVRVYRWREPTLSLGYFQHLATRGAHPSSQACPVVRRRSGGGAILHDQEWTYALAISPPGRFHGTTEALYTLVHGAWIDALARVSGAIARFAGQTDRASEDAFLCFRRRSRWDVTVSGTKVLGSSQRRSHRTILQHGSLLLRRSSCAPECPGVQELVTCELDDDALVEEWLKILAARLGRTLQPAPLAEKELARVDYWRAERYGTDAWTRRRS